MIVLFWLLIIGIIVLTLLSIFGNIHKYIAYELDPKKAWAAWNQFKSLCEKEGFVVILKHVEQSSVCIQFYYSLKNKIPRN